MISAFEARWFSSMWLAAHEPPLANIRSDRRVWRFTTLPSFHHPVVVRIEEVAAAGLQMTAKRLSRAGGYEPGSIEAQVRRPLTTAETDAFLAAVRTAKPLWAQPRDCSVGVDGTMMILERSGAGGYGVAVRWSPQDGPMRAIGQLLVGLAGWGAAAAG